MEKIVLLFINLLLIVGFLPNGTLAQNYTQWQLPEGAKARLGKGKINDVKFSLDGDLLAVATDIGVWLYDVHTGVEIALLNKQPKDVRTVTFSPDGKTLATGGWSREGAIQLWDIAAATQISTMGKDVVGSIGVLAFSEDGKVLAGIGLDYGLRFYTWDVDTGLEVSHFKGQQNHINYGVLAVSPNHRFAASAGGNKIFLWDTETQTLKHTIEADSASNLAFSPDSKTLVSGSMTIQLWDVETGTQMVRLDGHTDRVDALTFSPDGKTLASAARQEPMMALWDINNIGSKTVLLVEGNLGTDALAFALAFSPDGKTLVSGHSGGRIYASDIATREQFPIFTRHPSSITALAFSPDGKILVTGSGDGSIRLLYANTYRPIRDALIGHANPISELTFSPDRDTLFSGGADGTILVWDLGNVIHKE